MDFKINELTQDMAEKLIDALPDERMSGVKYQGVFVRAAIEVGWITLDSPLTLRSDVVKIYGQLNKLWLEINTIPNAQSSPSPATQTARETSPAS